MQGVPRRWFARLVCGLVCGGSLAGCLEAGDTDDGADDAGDDGRSRDDVPERIRVHLEGARGYDGEMQRRRGEAAVQIDVGADPGGIAFDPPALRIDVGTRVTWVWTGRGSNHDVVSVDGSDMGFRSERTGEAGHEFEQTFEEPGVALYECLPHRSQGMLGAIEAVEPDATEESS